MNEIEKIESEICSNYENGYISESEKDMLFVALEMKTRNEYSIEKFKKKYNYDNSSEEVKKYGFPTITVDGEKFPIDLKNSYKNKEIPLYRIDEVDGEGEDDELRKVQYSRVTGAIMGTKDGLIVLTPEFFKLKNQGRKAAALYHEIGHLKMHDNIKNKRVKPEAASKEIGDSIIDDHTAADYNSNKYGSDKNFGGKDKKIKFIRGRNKASAPSDDDIDEKRSKADEDLLASRDRGAKAAIALGHKPGTHKSPKEYEADRYAANRTSEKDVRKSIREMGKHAIKQEYKNIQAANRAIRKSNLPQETKDKLLNDPDKAVDALKKANDEATKARFNAIRDEVLRKEKFYKKKEED